MGLRISLFLFLALFFRTLTSKGQGCSDAGLCTVGLLSINQFKYESLPYEETNLKPLTVEDTDVTGKITDTLSLKHIPSESEKQKAKTDKKGATIIKYSQQAKYYLQVLGQFGVGEQKTSIYSTVLEGNATIIKNKLFAQARLPHSIISGPLGSVSGFGDPVISLSYIVHNKSNSNLSFTGGVKLPVNRANIELNGLPLPMVYQTSLGSTDLLLGARYIYKHWDLATGYQHSFNRTHNQYLYWPIPGAPAQYNLFTESRELKRADDVIFRVLRNFSWKGSTISPGVLGIYHLYNDEITSMFGDRVSVQGSKGMTLNLNLAGVIPLTYNTDLVFTFAKPVVIREVPTDGLMRVYVINAGLRWSRF